MVSMASPRPIKGEIARRVRCVVWSSQGRLPEGLVAALVRPDLDVVYVRDEFRAIAELCKGSGPRSHEARRERAIQFGEEYSVEMPVLLVIEPALTRGLQHVLRAADRFAPFSVVWVWETRRSGGGTVGRLRSASPEERATWMQDTMLELAAGAVDHPPGRRSVTHATRPTAPHATPGPMLKVVPAWDAAQPADDVGNRVGNRGGMGKREKEGIAGGGMERGTESGIRSGLLSASVLLTDQELEVLLSTEILPANNVDA